MDNVTFGEPAAFYGLPTLIAGVAIIRAETKAEQGRRPLDLVATLRPFLYVAAVGGIGLIMFAAPVCTSASGVRRTSNPSPVTWPAR